MFEITTEHLEDDTTQGKEILVGFEAFVSLAEVSFGENFCVDSPNYVVEDRRQKGHNMLKDAYYFEVQRLFALYGLYYGRYLVQEFQKLKYFPRILHSYF